jgi:hypothetical protein
MFMNSYELVWRDRTTGWDATKNDINGLNAYNMRPIEVAAQAGDIEEFRAIVNDPAFNAAGARPFFFADVGRKFGGFNAEQRYAALVPELAAFRKRFAS